MPKNQGVYLYFTLKLKKGYLFLTFTRSYENLMKVPSSISGRFRHFYFLQKRGLGK